MRGGVIQDSVLHAVVRRRLQRHALCGAGRIRLVLLSEFRAEDHSSCKECSKLVGKPAQTTN